MEFETLYVGLLIRGPNWTPAESPELDQLQADHLAHKRRMAEAGFLIMNGPCADDGNLRGISVYKAGSLAEAQALAAEDPMVKIGRLVMEWHPGWCRSNADFPPSFGLIAPSHSSYAKFGLSR